MEVVMQEHPNPVRWTAWLRAHRPDELRQPDRVITQGGDRRHCKLCDRQVIGDRAAHHLAHMVEMDEFLAGTPKTNPDSRRRVEQRREKRLEALDRARAARR